ncbi:MAG TPA: radical SAM protein [Bacteroidales bacterium]|nr:radical SAM protein [Bacteroidales bacterium]
MKLYREGHLLDRSGMLTGILEDCTLCPRNCRINRRDGEKGICRTGRYAMVSSFSPHYGEERPLVGRKGSGTVFFTNCNLLCNFCQNYDISHLGHGVEVSDVQLADIMLHLQEIGCHNINLVTPTHVIPQIIEALIIAIEKGLRLPIVYNCGGYDSIESLRMVEGIIDIYMPDFKFWDNRYAQMTCGVNDYREIAMSAINEMYRQVGDLQIDETGIAVKGLLVRHLLMPGNIAGTKQIVDFLADLSKETYLNIMAQYRPRGSSLNIIGKLAGRITTEEYTNAINYALDRGLGRLDP